MVCSNLATPIFTVEDAVLLALQTGARESGGTDMLTLAPAMAQRFELTYMTSNSIADVKAWLGAGGMAICNVGGNRSGYTGLFSDGGHYVVAAAASGDYIGVLDPNYYKGKFDKAGRKGKVTMDGNLAWVSGADLDKDCSNRNPRYYLFRRA